MRLCARKSGVIMTVSAHYSRTGIPFVGGYGPAQAAKEALTRHLSAELAPHYAHVGSVIVPRPGAATTVRRILEVRWHSALCARDLGFPISRLGRLARQRSS
jgi:NAD(P)-dependent dehydrogenase (short-subunit alcohol dehydrogenase family)